MKKTVKAYIDRIEGDLAVVYLGEEEEHKVNIPVKYLPKDIKENTKLSIDISIQKEDSDNTAKQVEDMRKMLIDGS
ncbi:MAG: DUF3006 domain-containing protein [Candidatus Sericytochromatia bacterium]